MVVRRSSTWSAKLATCARYLSRIGSRAQASPGPSVPIAGGKLFRSIRKNGAVWGEGITQNVVWYVVKDCAQRVGIKPLAPHDLRRSCARLCHAAGGELEQIQFLLGHASVQTTERYIGCKQDLCRARQ